MSVRITGNHSHLNRHEVTSIESSIEYFSQFRYKIETMKVLGNKVGVASCSTHLITSCD